MIQYAALLFVVVGSAQFAVRATGEHAAVAEEQQIPLRDLHQGKRIRARDDGEGDGGGNRVHQVAAVHQSLRLA